MGGRLTMSNPQHNISESPSQSPSQRDNQWGSFYMTIGMFGFVVNDSLMKLVLQDIPVMQAIFIRGVIASLAMLLLVRLTGGLTGLLKNWHPLLLVRALGETGAAFLYLTAITYLPIANATAILMAMSLFVTLAAALFLGEQVGVRRYLAIAVGFIGVLIILRPGGDDFNIYSLYVLAAIMFMVIRDLATRKMPATMPSVVIATTSMIGVMLMGGLGMMFQGWQPVPDVRYLPLLSAAALLVLGFQFSVLALRRGDISITAIFRYTSLIWGGLMGFLIFNEIPHWTMWLGSAIIIGAGLFVLWRERLSRKPV